MKVTPYFLKNSNMKYSIKHKNGTEVQNRKMITSVGTIEVIDGQIEIPEEDFQTLKSTDFGFIISDMSANSGADEKVTLIEDNPSDRFSEMRKELMTEKVSDLKLILKEAQESGKITDEQYGVFSSKTVKEKKDIVEFIINNLS